jgi:hypothetical protein
MIRRNFFNLHGSKGKNEECRLNCDILYAQITSPIAVGQSPPVLGSRYFAIEGIQVHFNFREIRKYHFNNLIILSVCIDICTGSKMFTCSETFKSPSMLLK